MCQITAVLRGLARARIVAERARETVSGGGARDANCTKSVAVRAADPSVPPSARSRFRLVSVRRSNGEVC